MEYFLPWPREVCIFSTYEKDTCRDYSVRWKFDTDPNPVTEVNERAVGSDGERNGRHLPSDTTGAVQTYNTMQALLRKRLRCCHFSIL